MLKTSDWLHLCSEGATSVRLREALQEEAKTVGGLSPSWEYSRYRERNTLKKEVTSSFHGHMNKVQRLVGAAYAAKCSAVFWTMPP